MIMFQWWVNLYPGLTRDGISVAIGWQKVVSTYRVVMCNRLLQCVQRTVMHAQNGSTHIGIPSFTMQGSQPFCFFQSQSKVSYTGKKLLLLHHKCHLHSYITCVENISSVALKEKPARRPPQSIQYMQLCPEMLLRCVYYITWKSQGNAQLGGE